MSIGTWNVQGINMKRIEVFEEIKKMKVGIAVLSETKKKGQGVEEINDYIHIYSGVNKEFRAKKGISIAVLKKYKNNIKSWSCVSENLLTVDFKIKGIEMVVVGVYAPNDNAPELEKDKFFNQLTTVLDGIPNRKDVFLLGDFNSRVGRLEQDEVVGRYGEEVVNGNGERLIELCAQYNLTIWNGFFKHKEIHKFTWSRGTSKTIIDYVIGKHNNKVKVEDVRVYRGAECNTDHYLLKSKVYLPYVNKSQPEIQVAPYTIKNEEYELSLLDDPSITFLYKLRLSKTLLDVDHTTTQTLYDGIVKAVHQAAFESLGEIERRVGKGTCDSWWNTSLAGKVREKKIAYNTWLSTQDIKDRQRYSKISREVKQEVRRAKNEAWERECEKIDQCIGNTRARNAWEIIKNLRQNEKRSSALQPISVEQFKVYYEKLMKEDRPEFSQMYNIACNESENIDDITADETKRIINTFRNGKSAGPGSVNIELLKHGPSSLFEILTQLYNRCLKGEELPQDFKKGYISNIYKKGDRKQCTNYRGITVLSSIGRVYGKILKFRLERDLIDVEEQSGFRAGRSCIDNIFSIKQVTDKRLAHNLETHLVFVDLRKAYDTVPLSRLWMAMEKQNVNPLLIGAIKNLYSGNSSQIKVGRNVSEPFQVNKGLRQGCCIAPTLFKLYLNEALRRWRKKCCNMGVKIEDSMLYSLHFADDQVLFAEDEDDILYMLRKLHEEYSEWGLEINLSKTEYMVVGASAKGLKLDDGSEVKPCQTFTYLGTQINENGGSSQEIVNRIVKGKAAIRQLHPLIWKGGLSKNVKRRLYKTVVESIAIYGSEVWEISKKNEKKLKAMEMDFWRRSCGLTLLDKVKNEEIKRKAEVSINIMDTIEVKRLKWYGHIQRMGEERWPQKLWHWQPATRRKRGRPRFTWREGVEEAMTKRGLTQDDCSDRQRWRLGCERRPRV